MNIFSYAFMNRAFIAGILLAVIIPLIGLVVVLRRLSMIGDALSHSSLAGVAIGLVLGFNPVLGAMVASVVSALAIELIRKKFPNYGELSIAIIMSAGVGITGVLSGYGSGTSNISSYMFGSIVAISDFEMALILIVSVVVIAAFVLLYKELFYLSLSESGASMAGVPIRFVSSLFTILTALTIAIAARTVGALVVSSLIVVPVACGMQLAKSYRSTLFYSIIFALTFTIAGLFLSFYVGIRPGGAIVLTGVSVLIMILILKTLFKKGGAKNNEI